MKSPDELSDKEEESEDKDFNLLAGATIPLEFLKLILAPCSESITRTVDENHKNCFQKLHGKNPGENFVLIACMKK